jgi:hypothetical protein
LLPAQRKKGGQFLVNVLLIVVAILGTADSSYLKREGLAHILIGYNILIGHSGWPSSAEAEFPFLGAA